jgi:isopenicillin N synthase-like dioxygenase
MAIPLSRRLDFAEIPVIDAAALIAEDPQTIAALATACADIGFIYVKNHGVDPALVTAMEAQAARFFARSMDEKMTIAVNPRMRGYLPLNYKSLEGEAGGGVSAQEGFWIGHERPLSDDVLLDGPNVWLPSQPELEPVMLDYFAAVEALSVVLQRGFAFALGFDRDYFAPRFSKPLSRLKLNHYPPQDIPETDRHIGVVGHTDSGAFTILWQDDNGGLEIQTKSGDWVGASPIPGTFVINLGDVMQIWTNGRFSSTPHRVINRGGKDRYSVPLFVQPNHGAAVEPLFGDAPPDFTPMRYGDYQRGMYRRIFPVAGIPA